MKSEKAPGSRKLRRAAKEYVRIGQKIFFHKRDQLSEEVKREWEESMEGLIGMITQTASKSTRSIWIGGWVLLVLALYLNANFWPFLLLSIGCFSLASFLSDRVTMEASELEQLHKQIEQMDKLCARSGEAFYHKKGWVENIEMFLVAAIIVIGVRSFFLQPFIIPTNSMYPSFYGMKAHIYEKNEAPTQSQRLSNKLVFGASHYRLETEEAGVPLLLTSYKNVTANFPAGKFFVFPTTVREYVLEIGTQSIPIRVPTEFSDLENVLAKGISKFTPNEKWPTIEQIRNKIPQDFTIMVRGKEVPAKEARAFAALILEKEQQRQNIYRPISEGGAFNPADKSFLYRGIRISRSYTLEEIDAVQQRVKLSEEVKKGLLLAFDIRLGDALFVDRFSYNFRAPSVGDPIVFQTSGIDEYNRELQVEGYLDDNGKRMYAPRQQQEIGEEKYYIKRLVGTAGDDLKIESSGFDRPGYLKRKRNKSDKWEHIQGCTAFNENRKVVDRLSEAKSSESSKYTGYMPTGALWPGSTLRVPTKSFFTMGDNSPNSKDGRAWGFVPHGKVVGRAFLVYYPFTSRWGFPD